MIEEKYPDVEVEINCGGQPIYYFVNTEKGRLISVTDKMSYDNILEIVGVIAECAESVKMNPRHTLTRNNEE